MHDERVGDGLSILESDTRARRLATKAGWSNERGGEGWEHKRPRIDTLRLSNCEDGFSVVENQAIGNRNERESLVKLCKSPVMT